MDIIQLLHHFKVLIYIEDDQNERGGSEKIEY